MKEAFFISETLQDLFLPTSLRAEDGSEYLSNLLRNVKTREDISWTTLHETRVGNKAAAIANRHEGFAAEPYGMTERFKTVACTLAPAREGLGGKLEQ